VLTLPELSAAVNPFLQGVFDFQTKAPMSSRQHRPPFSECLSNCLDVSLGHKFSRICLSTRRIISPLKGKFSLLHILHRVKRFGGIGSKLLTQTHYLFFAHDAGYILLLWIRSFLNKICVLSTMKDYTETFPPVKGKRVVLP